MQYALRLFLMCVAIALGAQACAENRIMAAGNDSNLYATALYASLAEMDNSWGRQQNSLDGRQLSAYYHNMPVRADFAITEGLPTQQGDYQVEFLDSAALIQRRQRLHKDFPILRLFPIHVEGHLLKIHVAENWVGLKGGQLTEAISDWSDVDFQFDCEKQVFVVVGVKLGGI